MFKTTNILTMILSVAAIAPVAANAETVSVRVDHADLNLATQSGRAVLDRRIALAAREICGSPDAEQNLALKMSARRCTKAVLKSAAPARLAALQRSQRAAS